MSTVRDVEVGVDRDDQEENVLVTVDAEIGTVVAWVRADADAEQVAELLGDVGREVDRELGNGGAP